MKRDNGYGLDRLAGGAAGRAVFGLVSSLALAAALTGPAMAQLRSEATVTGTAGDAEVQATDTQTTEMQALQPALVAMAEATFDPTRGDDAENADAGDTVTVTVTVTNNGNISVDRVGIRDASLTIGGEPVAIEAAEFEPPSEAIAIDDTMTFTAIKALTAEQVYRAVAGDGIIVNTGASGVVKGQDVTASVEPVVVRVAPHAALSIVTTSNLTKADGNAGEGAEAGDTITYVYRVDNVGNVSVANVSVTVDLAGRTLQSSGTPDLGVEPFAIAAAADDPLGLNNDDPATAGVYENLGPGGATAFTHVHTVTQAEFEAQ